MNKLLAAAAAATALFGATFSLPSAAHGPGGHDGAISAPENPRVPAPWDVVHAKVGVEGNQVVFHLHTRGQAGNVKAKTVGKFAGSQVLAYVWPTSLDPSVVGFEPKTGILAFAVTAHPDFDDTPLFDENGDGRVDNDGGRWHSHWVVLTKDASCGPAGLKVQDIPAGEKPRLPRTWPGAPILIDSPGWSPAFDRQSVTVRVPFDDVGVVQGARFDGVTAALRVNGNLHAPLLCVSDVYKVVSGNLSLPGEVTPATPAR